MKTLIVASASPVLEAGIVNDPLRLVIRHQFSTTDKPITRKQWHRLPAEQRAALYNDAVHWLESSSSEHADVFLPIDTEPLPCADLVSEPSVGGAPATPVSDTLPVSTLESRPRLTSAEARREYQRRYYQLHREQAKEYQRQYNLTHKKKLRGGRGKSSFNAPREVVRSTLNTADIMHSPVEKTVRMLEKIIRGERLFTM